MTIRMQTIPSGEGWIIIERESSPYVGGSVGPWEAVTDESDFTTMIYASRIEAVNALGKMIPSAWAQRDRAGRVEQRVVKYSSPQATKAMDRTRSRLHPMPAQY